MYVNSNFIELSRWADLCRAHLCSPVIQIEEDKQKKSNIKRKVCLELLKKEQKIFVLFLSRNQHLRNKMT